MADWGATGVLAQEPVREGLSEGDFVYSGTSLSHGAAILEPQTITTLLSDGAITKTRFPYWHGDAVFVGSVTTLGAVPGFARSPVRGLNWGQIVRLGGTLTDTKIYRG